MTNDELKDANSSVFAKFVGHLGRAGVGYWRNGFLVVVPSK